MEHIKTLNTKSLQNTVKKADVVSARHPVSQPAKHPAQWETRAARINNRNRTQRASYYKK